MKGKGVFEQMGEQKANTVRGETVLPLHGPDGIGHAPSQPNGFPYDQGLGLTDREMRKLKRSDLLEMLVEQGRELERVRGELSRAQAELKERRIQIDTCGSIAEAALKMNGVFEAAQAAADQYLQSVKAVYPQGPLPAIEVESAQKPIGRHAAPYGNLGRAQSMCASGEFSAASVQEQTPPPLRGYATDV